MPGDPGATVVTNARATYSTRAAAGATGTRHSPLPSWGSARSLLRVAPRPLGAKDSGNNSGASRGENAEVCLGLATSLRGAKRRSNPFFSSRLYGLRRFARNDDLLVVARESGRSSNPRRGEGSERSRRTGYPAGARHRARRRRDPVAEQDGRCKTTRRAKPVRPARWLSARFRRRANPVRWPASARRLPYVCSAGNLGDRARAPPAADNFQHFRGNDRTASWVFSYPNLAAQELGAGRI